VSPQSEIQKILSFLNIAPAAENLAGVFRIPKIPESLGRYRMQDIGQFDPADLNQLSDLGFSLAADD